MPFWMKARVGERKAIPSGYLHAVGMVQVTGLDGLPVIRFEGFYQDSGTDCFSYFGTDTADKEFFGLHFVLVY